MRPLGCIILAAALLGCRERAVAPATPPPTAATAAPVARSQTPRPGDPAPDFTLTDQAGNRVTLSSARGQNVILVFYRGYW